MNILNDIWTRGVDQLFGRLSGPLNLRFILTPVMVLILAIKAGWKDARDGQPPFLWNAITRPTERKAILESGWKAIKKVIIVALILDFVYQLYVLRAYYIIQSLILVTVVAVIPYVLIRGVTTRLMGLIYKKS